MRVLFAPYHERGHLLPLIGVAQRLSEEEHPLAFVTRRDIGTMLATAGVRAELHGGGAVAQTSPTALQPENLRWMRRWYATAALRGFSEASIAAAATAIERFRPDVVCADPIAYGAMIAAERAAIPWVAIATTLFSVAPRGFSCPMIEAIDSVHAELLTRFESAGARVTLSHHEVISPWLNTVFATEAFVPRELSQNDFSVFVGPLRWQRRGDEPEFPWTSLSPDRPIVYASFGGGEALAFPEQVVLTIAEALSSEDAQLVFALQHLADGPIAERLSRGTIAVRYAPQLALLERAAFAVTHGGANTVAECLGVGCPMLVLPIGHDHPLMAALVERAGCGIALPMRASAAEIREAAAALLRDDRYRQRAAEVGASYAASDAARAIAARVARLASDRAPQRPDPIP